MGKSLFVAAATVVAAAVLLFGVRLLGATGAAFAFLVVWAPMTWLGTVSSVAQPRLPRRYHELTDLERDPWLYELFGVRVVKRLLRRGPLAVFNPGLHLPAERSPERLAELEQRMNDAEASHLVLLVAMLGVVINAAARGWWIAAGLTLLFDMLMNGYPVMLQRYNRALLYAGFPTMHADPSSPVADGHPGQARPRPSGGALSYADTQVSSAITAIEKYRGGETGEVGAALAVVGLSAERAAKEAQIRDDMIRVAHRAGASLRQLAEVAGLDRKTVTAIVGAAVRSED